MRSLRIEKKANKSPANRKQRKRPQPKVTRQEYLLLAFAERHITGMKIDGQPRGYVPTCAVPYCVQIAPGHYIDSPGGIDMTNVRGLQRRGLVDEPKQNFFYLSDTGRMAAEELIKRLVEHRRA